MFAVQGANAQTVAPCGRWEAIPGSSLNGSIYAMKHWDPDGAGPASPVLIVGGTFTSAGGTAANGIAAWDGTSWSALGAGVGGPSQGTGPNGVFALEVLPNGELVAAGRFTSAGGTWASGIASWNGTSWRALGFGVNGTNGARVVSDLCVLPNGDLVAAGNFQSAGGAAATHIAKWNGSAWSPLGEGLAESTGALAVGSDGMLYAANQLGVYSWNGTYWNQIGVGSGVYALAFTPQRDLLAGGNFGRISGVEAYQLARWNGLSWSSMTQGTIGPRGVFAFLVPSESEMWIGGDFSSVGGSNNVACWNGVQWRHLGVRSSTHDDVYAFASMPNGDILAGGSFLGVGGNWDARYIARFVKVTFDFNRDGIAGDNADITDFFECLSGDCCPGCTADVDADTDVGTDADIEAFFRLISGERC